MGLQNSWNEPKGDVLAGQGNVPACVSSLPATKASMECDRSWSRALTEKSFTQHELP